MLALANVNATKLRSEPHTKVPMPMRHVRLVCGFACTLGDDCIAVACRFCPMLIRIEPTNPMRMPIITLPPPSGASQWEPAVELSATMCDGASVIGDVLSPIECCCVKRKVARGAVRCRGAV